MVQSVSATAFWGGDLTDEEIAELSGLVGAAIGEQASADLRKAYLDYCTNCALQDGALPASEVRKNLSDLERCARRAAKLLGGHQLDSDEFFAHRRPKDFAQPRTAIGREVEQRVELELIHFDIAFKKKHDFDPKFSSINMLHVAWELAQISRGARAAAASLSKKTRGGRPKSGAEQLVVGLIAILDSLGARPTCGYSDADGEYKGTFLRIIPWLHGLPQPVRESAATLCKFAATAPARKKTRPKNTVSS